MFRVCLVILLVHLVLVYGQGTNNNAPVLSINPRETWNIPNGTTVRLTCGLATSRDTIYFYRNNILLSLGNMRTKPVTVTSSGRYSCRVKTNGVGVESSSSNVISVSVIGISISPANSSVPSGSIVTLTCQASINGRAIYYFFRGNHRVHYGSNKSVSVTTSTGSWRYSCFALSLSTNASTSRSSEVSLTVVEWQKDNRTNKHYAVLTSRDDLAYNSSRALCGVEGYLAEPRDRHENQFISRLVNQRVYLGMKYHEASGQWQWQSDGTNVSWTNWQQWRGRDHLNTEPNGRYHQEYCAIILTGRDPYLRTSVTSTWADKRCDVRTRQVVCEKNQALECMNRQVEACYSFRNLLYTKKSIGATGNWTFLNNNPWSPNRNALCVNMNYLNKCINQRKSYCTRASENVNFANYFMKINQELCANSTINWDAWLNPRSVQIWTNNHTKALEAYQGWKACQTNSQEHSLFNFRYQNNTQAACSALISWLNCDIGVADDTGPHPYNDYTKTFVKMVWRATARTYLRDYLTSPYDCTAVKTRIGITN